MRSMSIWPLVRLASSGGWSNQISSTTSMVSRQRPEPDPSSASWKRCAHSFPMRGLPHRRFPPVAIWCDSRSRFHHERRPRSSDYRSPKMRPLHSATPCALPMAVSSSVGVTSSCPSTSTRSLRRMGSRRRPATCCRPSRRMTMLRGSTMTFQLGTAHVILVESGSLTITETPRGAASSLPEFPSDSTDLTDAEPIVALPGSAVVATGNSPYRIVNEGPAVARALLIRIAGYALSTDRPAFGAFGTSQNDVGVQIETLSAANALPNRKGDWTIEIGRATLAPGTTISAHEVAGSELILVEQGALDADLGTCAQRCVQTIEGAGALRHRAKPCASGTRHQRQRRRHVRIPRRRL